MRSIVVLFGLVSACFWGTGLANEAGQADTSTKGDTTPMRLSTSPADLKWSALPERPGVQFATLTGDPKTGPYTQLRKFPAGHDNPLHTHSSELTNVVITGTWYTGPDAAAARDFGQGSVVVMPAGWPHVSGCRPGIECLIYQIGKGKFDFNPVASGGGKGR